MNQFDRNESRQDRKAYEKPRVIHEEAIVAKATGCGKATPGGNAGACDTQGIAS